MTPTQFRAIREAMGVTQPSLADMIGVTDRTVRRYENGETHIPKPVAMLVRGIRVVVTDVTDVTASPAGEPK